MKYVLEPMLFAIDENMSEKDFKVFVTRLLTWDKWMDNNPDDIYVMSNTSDLLASLGYFPIYPVFSKLIEKYKVNYVQASDLNIIISKLLTKSKKIDETEGKKFADDAIFNGVKPDEEIEMKEYPEDMKDHFKLLLWHIYCQCKASREKIESFVLFARNLSQDLNMAIEYYTLDGDNMVKNREKVRVFCRSSLKDFFSDAKMPLSILRQTKTKKDMELAIRVSIYQNCGKDKKKIADSLKYDFTIQDSFWGNFVDAHYSVNDTVLNSLAEAMSHTMLAINNGHNREDFRTGKGGNNPQLTHEGGFSAWRRFVTSSVKMQYWQKDEYFKFANIGEHDYYVCKWED